MGKTDKLLAKILNSKKKTFEWDELVVLFSSLGYVKKEMQGQSAIFFNAEINHTILMHRPHPESYIKGGTLKAIKTESERGWIIMKHLKYKGYLGTVEPDFENNVLYGKTGVYSGPITYEASTLAELEQEFKTSVDLYLQSLCGGWKGTWYPV